ncbi:type 3 dihydrofolate reductase [Thorsellia anophelis]|uniref:Dihydrofolate reductase n=1 Tax=Thorsellia anophelis DSM 18579 TaxID=1123402 RepID=A0A1I0ERU4_9GAMM|nr:type 3 dihydrofolate reductase [Thorsellia anophelis]SET48060.1 dihydrofolate reductase [Thorsellia anophelis DSM 18579]
MIISLIAAIDNNRALGGDNKMLWHLPADFAWFKAHTLSKPVIMGRKTYESIGKALPNRLNIVLTRQELVLEDALVVSSLEEAFLKVKEASEIMVIGGADIYSQCLTKADRLYLTQVDATFQTADAFFPDYLNSNIAWHKTDEKYYPKDAKNAFDMTFMIFDRNRK